MCYWAIASILVKALAWSMSYALLAKGDSKVFFWNEFSTLIYSFILNILGYKLYGLTGMGISYFVIYVIYYIQLSVVTNRLYGVRLNKGLLKLFLFFKVLMVAVLLLKLLKVTWIAYLFGCVLLTFVTIVSYRELDKRVALTSFVRSKILKK